MEEMCESKVSFIIRNFAHKLKLNVEEKEENKRP